MVWITWVSQVHRKKDQAQIIAALKAHVDRRINQEEELNFANVNHV